jgi:ABC-type polysaccharide/polyol phosphate export permease
VSASTPLPSAPAARRGAFADFREIAADLNHHRDLLYQLTLRDIRIRYKQAVMGFGWAVLMPVLVVVSGLLVRLAVSFVSGRPLDRVVVAGIAVKAVPWGFFVTAIGFATTSLTGNSTLVSKIYFPREVLPLSSVLAAAFDATLGSAAVLLALFFVLEVDPTGTALWALPVMLLLFTFTVAAALFLSCANLFFRDVKYLVQILLTFGIFFTPVFFEVTMFGSLGAQLAMLNPLAPLLEGLRLSVVEGHNLAYTLTETVRGSTVVAWTPWYLAYSAAWAVGGLLAAALLFHRSEFIFAEYV